MSRIILCFSKFDFETVTKKIANNSLKSPVVDVSVNPSQYSGFSEFDALYEGRYHPMISLVVSQNAKKGRKLGPQILKLMSQVNSVVVLRTAIDIEGAGSNLSGPAKRYLHSLMLEFGSEFFDWGDFHLESIDQLLNDGSVENLENQDQSLDVVLDDRLKFLRKNLERATSNIYIADELRSWFHALEGEQQLIVGRIVEFGTLNTVELLENIENLSVERALGIVERSIDELASISTQRKVS